MSKQWTFERRVLRHVIRQPDGCWIWPRAKVWNGYGQVWNGNKLVMVHRYVYENMVGPVPEGMQLDHLCRNRLCCNPEHLEIVTPRENTLRGIGPALSAARQKSKTCCPNGHPYSGENLYVYKRERGCRICRAAARRRYNERKKGLAESHG